MISKNNEKLIAVLYKRNPESFDFEEIPTCSFRCRLTTSKDESEYQPVAGLVFGDSDLTLYASRLDTEIKVGDKIVVLGEEKIVKGIGYYISEHNSLHDYDLKVEEIYKRSPKGIVLK